MRRMIAGRSRLIQRFSTWRTSKWPFEGMPLTNELLEKHSIIFWWLTLLSPKKTRLCYWILTRLLFFEALATAWVSAVTKEIWSLRIGDSVTLVAFFHTYTTASAVILKAACVAEVPMLIFEYLLGGRVCAILFGPLHVAEWIFITLSKLLLLESFNLYVV